MNTETNPTRPTLDSLACVCPTCELYGQAGQGNLTVRKVYGLDRIRYLRCRIYGSEFSERKNTALWNSKVREAKAISIAEHLSDGCALKSTARLAKVDPSTVRRLNQRLGQQGEAYHDDRVQQIAVEALEGDERHGYAIDKSHQVWEAELIDPGSKFIISHDQGRRDETLIRRLLSDGARRLLNRHDLVLFTDGESSYATLFPEVFGTPYQPKRRGSRGRWPNLRFRIPRTLAHVQIVKHRQGRRITKVDIRYTHGSKKRVAQALALLGYRLPNTSASERFNGTARRMSAHQVRRSLAFSRRPDTKHANGWWAVTVYNGCRPHRSLRQPLPEPIGRQLYRQRSPAMTIGLADHILSVEDFLRTPIYPPGGVRIISSDYPRHLTPENVPYPAPAIGRHGAQEYSGDQTEPARKMFTGCVGCGVERARSPHHHSTGERHSHRQARTCDQLASATRTTKVGAVARESRCLTRDNDKKYSMSFDTVFESEGISVVRTPFQAPTVNAHAERWVRTAREECLDHLLIWSDGHLRGVLTTFVDYYNTRRPHQGIEQQSPIARTPPDPATPVGCQQVLGGIINDYYRASNQLATQAT